jgi:hypothetical protein
VSLWKSVPDFHNHVTSFASSRSSGYTAFSDPDTPPAATTVARDEAHADVRRRRELRRHGHRPTSLVVPGRAEVDAPAALYATATSDVAGDATLDLAAGTRLKVLAVGAPATAGAPAMIQVQGLDDPSISGFVAADQLTPKDSRAPVVVGIDTGLGRLSPNDDGAADTCPDRRAVLGVRGLDADDQERGRDGRRHRVRLRGRGGDGVGRPGRRKAGRATGRTAGASAAPTPGRTGPRPRPAPSSSTPPRPP